VRAGEISKKDVKLNLLLTEERKLRVENALK
jgi:hypothetical protein